MRERVLGIVITGIFLVLSPAAGADDITSHGLTAMVGPSGQVEWGYRCGTAAPDAETLRQVEAALAGNRYQRQGKVITVPVVFHVLYTEDDEGNDVGKIPMEQLEAQIDVLDAAYAGFDFTLEAVDEVYAPDWFERCFQLNRRIKRELAVSPATTLNIYTCVPHYGPYLLLGFSTFPWSYDEDDSRHGVVMLYSSVPGGDAAPYDEGDTATHEIGHYLGLYHTFQGGCEPPGDEVDDTPYEATAAFYCPIGRDTCPDEGLDPIHNFMDYTDDACMDHFTTMQDDRMIAIVEEYRPTLAAGGS